MEAYFVADFFENPKDRNVVVLGKFNYNDAFRKNLLLRVMEDPSKSLEERERARETYDLLMGKCKGYYVSKGIYLPGGILGRIPKDAEPIPDFKQEEWEKALGFEELEIDKILKKLDKLRSGVYCYFNGKEKDMVYGVSGKCFLDWIHKHSRVRIEKNKSKPVTVLDRYNMLKLAEAHGFVFGRIPEEWGEFEKKMEEIESNKDRGLIRKV